MEYYCESIENLKTNSYVVRNDTIELKQNRLLFDNYKLNYQQIGRILPNLNGVSSSQTIIQWRLNYNCFYLIRENLKIFELETKSKLIILVEIF
jgi:hypothetical protein